MIRVSENAKKRLKKGFFAILLGFFVFCAVVLFPNFYAYIDTSASFTANNFSNTIYADNPTEIFFRVSGGRLEYLYTQFIPNSQDSLNTEVVISLKNEAGETLYTQTLQGKEIYNSSNINIVPGIELNRNDRVSLLIESDAKGEEDGWRIPMGTGESEIYQWTYNGIVDTDNTPGVHIVYYRFGIKTYGYCIVCALLVLLALGMKKTEIEKRFQNLIAGGLFFAAPVFSAFFCDFCNFDSILNKPLGVILINYLIVLSIQIAFFALTLRTAFAVALSTLAILVLSVANHFVRLFRGGVLTFFDVKVAGTAVNVISQYTFQADTTLILTCSTLLLLVFLAFRYNLHIVVKNWILTRIASLILAVIVFVFSMSEFALTWSGGEYYAFSANDSTRHMGLVYTFFYAANTSLLEKPEDYSADLLQSDTQGYVADPVSSEEELPDIILIMNESLTDHSMFVDLDLSADPLSFLHTLQEDDNPNTQVSTTVVPVIGGGTCNTEFEAITGMSIRNFDAGCYPYAQYVTNDTYAVSKYLSLLGYDTTFIHPGYRTSYNRDNVYQQFAFDHVYFEDDLQDPERIRDFVSDRFCYEMILERVENSDTPQFIFNVTIQNHGSWDAYGGEQTIALNHSAENMRPFENLMCLYKESDDAFRYLIECLSTREKPTLVVMFGDHQPAPSESFNSFIHMDEVYRTDPLTQYQTPVVFWANYDIQTEEIPQIFSTNYLNALVAEVGGIPLNGQQKFLLEMMEQFPIYTTEGIYDSGMNEVAAEDMEKKYERIQYAMLRDPDVLPAEFLAITR